jgi:NadR type nicotinamide-nucleotide adenylyltransferase
MEPLPRTDVTRIVLTGSESTGKTTLAARLAELYGVQCVPEFVREYALHRNGPLGFADHGPIARGQVALENEYVARADKLLFQDTDLVSTVVYCDHYFGRCPQFIMDAAVERQANLYLLLSTDIPWVADGIRDRGDRRDEMHRLFAGMLHKLGMRTIVIDGSDIDVRITKCIDAISSTLGISPDE